MSCSRTLRSYPGPCFVRWLKCHGDEQAGRKLEVKARRAMKRSSRGDKKEEVKEEEEEEDEVERPAG